MAKNQSTVTQKTALDALFEGIARLFSGDAKSEKTIVITDEVSVTGPFGDSAHGVSRTTISNVPSKGTSKHH